MGDQIELTRSVRFKRVGSPLAPRILRMPGDRELVASIRPATATDGGSLSVLTRDPVMVGERVRVAIGLGRDADPVQLSCMVGDVRSDDGASIVTLRVALAHAGRLTYVRDAVTGSGRTGERAARRVPVELEARVQWDGRGFTGVARDLSHGGAFIEGTPVPDVDTEVAVRIGSPEGTGLEVRARVTWIRTAQRPGFGVSFLSPGRATEKALAALLRGQHGDRLPPD